MVAFALLMVGSSCRKSTWTPYYALDGQQQVLLAREGDDGYLSPEMDGIIAGLRAAPENAREREQALKLADQLSAAQEKLRAQRAATAKVEPTPEPRRKWETEEPRPAPAAPTAQEDVDAGQLEPWAGMSEEEFIKLFGSCFSGGPASVGPDGGAATTRLVTADPACVARFGTAGKETEYLFLKDGLWGSRSRTRTLVPPTEAQTPTAPRLITAADAGERILTIPGAPVRDGYRTEFDAGY